MTAKLTTTKMTEAELEAHANEALKVAVPWLDRKAIRHQLTFSFKLGHKSVEINGTKASSRQGRVDMLIERGDERIAILELKRPGASLTADDVEQGLSYARVLHPSPPLVIVSNGSETRCYASHCGRLLNAGERDEAAFSNLISNALKVAESDLKSAIGTLMGPSSDVWMAAVRAASRESLEALSGDWDDHFATFTNGFHIPRKATALVRKALRESRRVVAIEGEPLTGKSHVAGELALVTSNETDMAILFVEASGNAAVGIADEIARILSSALGWRISSEEARNWLQSIGNAGGPQLVIVVDGLGLEHDAIRQELQALTSQSSGQCLKFVIEADTAVIDRLWMGETRRKPTVFARRGTRISVENLDDQEFDQARRVMYENGAEFMHGADRAEEYRQPWLLQSMVAGVATAPDRPDNSTAILPPLLSLGIFDYTRARFVQDPLIEQAATFARTVIEDYQRNDRSPDLRLRALHSFLVRKKVLREYAEEEDLRAMAQSGLLGSTLDSSNRALLVGRMPELIASEIAREIAAELGTRIDADKDKEAAQWFVRVCTGLPMGDVIGAQSLIESAQARSGLPLPFINHLLDRRPSIRPLKSGTKAMLWVPEIGSLEMTVRGDGSAFLKARGSPHRLELPAEEISVTYGDLDAWLMLSHLASVPIGAYSVDEDRVVGLFDAAVLGLVGTSPIPLRRVVIDPDRSGMHLHDAPDGASLVCSKEGIIEPITWSIFRFLDRHGEDADSWLVEACEQGSAALLSRILIALTQLGLLESQPSKAKWARDSRDELVRPAFDLAMA